MTSTATAAATAVFFALQFFLRCSFFALQFFLRRSFFCVAVFFALLFFVATASHSQRYQVRSRVGRDAK